MMMKPIAASPTADAKILAALAKWQDLHRMRTALPVDLPVLPGDSQSAEEVELWQQIDAEEGIIRSEKACSPEGVIAQLRVSLAHSLDLRTHEEVVIAGDLQGLFDVEDELDSEHRMIICAMRSLLLMGAASSDAVPAGDEELSFHAKNTFGELGGRSEDIVALLDSIVMQLEEMQEWTKDGGASADWVTNARLWTAWRLAFLAKNVCDDITQVCEKLAR
jgi:hypothetical protein